MTPEHRRLIDHTLLTVAGALTARLRDLTPQLQTAATRLSLEDLRASPLGRNLALLAHVVDGEPAVPRSRVVAAINFVRISLFVPLASPDGGTSFVGISPALLEMPIGQLLNAARARTLDVSTAVLLGEAARQLGLGRSLLYRMVERGELAVIDVGGRKLLSREEYERLAARCARENLAAREDAASRRGDEQAEQEPEDAAWRSH